MHDAGDHRGQSVTQRAFPLSFGYVWPNIVGTPLGIQLEGPEFRAGRHGPPG